MALVYSTEKGRTCSACGEAIGHCRCKKMAASQKLPNDGVVRISRETKGRKGKGVTLVTGLPVSENELKALSKKLKQQCSTGGTVKDGVIEIQGDHREKLMNELQSLGYTVKKAGG